jgi:hypothetical protein
VVIAGPDPERDGVVLWRCVDLQAYVASHYAVWLAEGSIGRLLRRIRLTRLQPRPYHPQKDVEGQATLKKTSPHRSKKLCRPMRQESRSKSGSRTKPESARRVP